MSQQLCMVDCIVNINIFSFFFLLVTAQLECLMDLLITHKYPPLIIGPTGTGKSTVINRMLNKTLPQDTYKPILLAFTAKTTAGQWQTIVDAKLDKRRRGIYGPAFGCTAIIFVDDLYVFHFYFSILVQSAITTMCHVHYWELTHLFHLFFFL